MVPTGPGGTPSPPQLGQGAKSRGAAQPWAVPGHHWDGCQSVLSVWRSHQRARSQWHPNGAAALPLPASTQEVLLGLMEGEKIILHTRRIQRTHSDTGESLSTDIHYLVSLWLITFPFFFYFIYLFVLIKETAQRHKKGNKKFCQTAAPVKEQGQKN